MLLKQHILETLIGTAVVAVAVYFAFFAYHEAELNAGTNGYSLSAKFDSVSGLNRGSDVRISGLKIGSVTNQRLDDVTYQAIIDFTVENAIQLPKDTSAEVVSDGLLGDKYLALVPGAEDAMLKEGDVIAFTQSSVSLEKLLSKVAFGSVEENDSASEDDPFALD